MRSKPRLRLADDAALIVERDESGQLELVGSCKL
jgi:hypothetical protein